MINLGDKVEDTISGFKGTAVAKHLYLQGCTRFSVQPLIGKDGNFRDTETFDEPQLILLKKSKIKKQSMGNYGGPEKYTDTRNY